MKTFLFTFGVRKKYLPTEIVENKENVLSG